MKIRYTTIRATNVALIFFLFSISYVHAQWKWHGHPQIGTISNFEIYNENIYLLRAQNERENSFTESLVKLSLDGEILLEDSLVLQINHPSVNSFMSILNDYIVISNYDKTEFDPNQKLIKYYFDKVNFQLDREIEVGFNHGTNRSTTQVLKNEDSGREVNFGSHFRYDDVNAKDGELLFQFWSPNLGLVHEFRYEIDDKEGQSVPTPVDLISTDFGYIGAAFYKSNRSHLYCYDHDGELFDVKELGANLYQPPQRFFDVKQILPASDGYYIVGTLEIGDFLVYIKLDKQLNVEWTYDVWRQDTSEFATLDSFQTKSILSQDGHIYTAGWESVSDAPGGDPRGRQTYKYLIKFDPVERQIVWVSRLDEHYGQLWDLEESDDGRIFVSGAWDKDGDFIPPLALDFDSWFIAEVDSLGRIEPIVSISEETNSELWTVFPNPANNILHIQAKIQNRQTQWSAYDLQGRLFWQAEGIVNTVDMSMWPEGVYVIRRQQGEDVSIKRVIKM
jgi:hypothetical protein